MLESHIQMLIIVAKVFPPKPYKSRGVKNLCER